VRRVALTLAVLAALVACAGATSASRAAPPPAQRFLSRPDVRPPLVHVVKRARGTAPGYIFIAPKKEVDQAGPLILDDAGNVVWFHPLDTHGVTDFRVQRYRGRPVLTWWRGETAKGIGNGRYVIVDDKYHVIANVTAGHGLSGDIHEFLITKRNTALFTIYRRVDADLSALGGTSDGRVEEGVVQEVAIPSGKVLFEWHSAPHVAVDETYEPVQKDASEPFDYFHINAVEPDGDDKLLVSARHTHTIYAIRRRDGAVLWRLGGKKSDFRVGAGAHFAWQHDPRLHSDGTLSLFDNGASRPAKGAHSRVLVVRLDTRRHTARLVRSYTHGPKPLLSTSQGNGQVLPDGHVFVGWGSNEYFTEFDRSGRILLDARFGSGESDSYRAYRFPWVGHPADRPAVAARLTRGRTLVYASWNGATEVRSWRLLAGASRAGLRAIAEEPKHGFETRIAVATRARYVQVQALDERGRVLRASPSVRPISR
jgi:Arylsulfotransferase (ASST)